MFQIWVFFNFPITTISANCQVRFYEINMLVIFINGTGTHMQHNYKVAQNVVHIFFTTVLVKYHDYPISRTTCRNVQTKHMEHFTQLYYQHLPCNYCASQNTTTIFQNSVTNPITIVFSHINSYVMMWLVRETNITIFLTNIQVLPGLMSLLACMLYQSDKSYETSTSITQNYMYVTNITTTLWVGWGS